MIKILFICHGNICRSPMAEYILKDELAKRGLSDRVYVDSKATTTEEIGNPVYPPVRKLLNGVGIDTTGKSASKMKRSDYDDFDYIIAMDRENLWGLERIIGTDTDNKVTLLMDYTKRPGDVSDPWYTRDFQTAYDDIYEGCIGLIDYLVKEEF